MASAFPTIAMHAHTNPADVAACVHDAEPATSWARNGMLPDDAARHWK